MKGECHAAAAPLVGCARHQFAKHCLRLAFVRQRRPESPPHCVTRTLSRCHSLSLSRDSYKVNTVYAARRVERLSLDDARRTLLANRVAALPLALGCVLFEAIAAII